MTGTPGKKRRARSKAPTRGARATTARAPATRAPESAVHARVQSALSWLKSHSSRATLESMARYGIPSQNALGVTMANMKKLGKLLGRDHALAAGLWDSGVYEARMVASFVADPSRLTASEMKRWCRDFDNWAICDTVCFNLFDRSPLAWGQLKVWAKGRDEFVKRAAFALIWSLSVHAKDVDDAPFLNCFPLIERAAKDERNFVKKAVNMALRAVGKRSRSLNAAAVLVARRLAASSDPSAGWVGRHALRELTSSAVTKRLAARER